MSAGQSGGRRRWLFWTGVAAVSLFAVFLIVDLAAHPEKYQWDFRTYYHAAQADATGLNPYDTDEISRLAGPGRIPPFVYPPIVLTFFRPFTALPYETAAIAWLVLKLALLAGLVMVWRRFFFRDEPPLPWAVFLVLGFGSALYLDLMTGNVSIVEQLLLWSGCAMLLRGNQTLFGVLVVLSSLFKLTPIAFLLLPLLLDNPVRWKPFVLSVLLIAVVIGVGHWLDPVNWSRFWGAALALEEKGALGNPSLLSFISDLVVKTGAAFHTAPSGAISTALYAILGATILVTTLRRWRRMRPLRSDDARLDVLYLFCVTYALILPRFKSYSFIMLLPAAYYALRRAADLRGFPFLLVLFVLTAFTPLPVRLPMQTAISLFWLYYPLILAFVIWGLMLYTHDRRATASKVSGAPGS